MRAFAKRNYIPIVRDKTIMAVAEIIEKENYKNFLEIGTAIGYSGIIMLSSQKGAKLTSIEKNESRYNEALKNFKNIGLDTDVNLILGDAGEKLQELEKSGQKFDFIFLDGPKGQYISYYPHLKNMLSENGTIFADNVLLGGLIKNAEKVTHKNRTMTVKMQKFIDTIMADEDFDANLNELDDGFIVAKLKKSTEY